MSLKLTLFIFIILVILVLPTSSLAVSSHENAIQNLNTGLLPSDLSKQITPKEKSFFEKVIDNIFSLLGFKAEQIETLYPGADIQQKSNIPQEIKPNNTDPNNLPKFLGEDKQVGIYQTDTPRETQLGLNKTIDFENLYENAYFPKGVNPITKK